MSDAKTRISIEGSKKVLLFYLKFLNEFKWRSFLLIFSGFLLRGISIFIFVLILKIFMTIIDPNASLETLNNFLTNNFNYTVNEDTMLLSLLGGLTGLIVFQLIIGMINLALSVGARAKLVEYCLRNPLNVHRDTHLHIAIDHIPPGYDAIIKSSEILFFYVILFICIFYMSPLMGLAVLISVPLVLVLLLIKGRKEVFITQEFRELRKNYLPDSGSEDLTKLIHVSCLLYTSPSPRD